MRIATACVVVLGAFFLSTSASADDQTVLVPIKDKPGEHMRFRKLDVKTSIKFENVTLHEAVSEIANTHGINVVVAEKLGARVVSAKLTGVPLRTVLSVLAHQADAQINEDRYVTLIVPKASVTRQATTTVSINAAVLDADKQLRTRLIRITNALNMMPDAIVPKGSSRQESRRSGNGGALQVTAGRVIYEIKTMRNSFRSPNASGVAFDAGEYTSIVLRADLVVGDIRAWVDPKTDELPSEPTGQVAAVTAQIQTLRNEVARLTKLVRLLKSPVPPSNVK